MMLKLVLLGIFLILSQARSQTVDDCPPEVPRDKDLHVHGNVCYQFVLSRHVSHKVAKEFCELNGGSLPLVKTEEINNYLVDVLKEDYRGGGRVWIGLQDQEKEGAFFWADGTPLDATVYANWGNSQGHHSNEDCVVLDPRLGGKWHDYPCARSGFIDFQYTSMAYICQYEIPLYNTTTASIEPTWTPPASITTQSTIITTAESNSTIAQTTPTSPEATPTTEKTSQTTPELTTTVPSTTSTKPGTTSTKPGTTSTKPVSTSTKPSTTSTKPGTTSTKPSN